MKRSLKGKVVSARMQDTIVVSVETRKTHPIYRKKYLWHQKFMAENKINAKEGDFVSIEECQPLSKNKRWKATKIVSEKDLGEKE
jgi:small subunit ribosomal protein S17